MNGFTTKNKQHIAQLGVQQIFHGFEDLSKNENSMIILAIIDKAQKIKYILYLHSICLKLAELVRQHIYIIHAKYHRDLYISFGPVTL